MQYVHVVHWNCVNVQCMACCVSGSQSPRPEPNIKSMEGAETLCLPATAPKPERSGEDLYGGAGQNPFCSVLQTWSRTTGNV